MLISSKKSVKLFLYSIFTVLVCASLHATKAGERGIIFENEEALIAGKEYLFIQSAPRDKSILQEQSAQQDLKIGENQIFQNEYSNIYIAENIMIYVKGYLFVKQNTCQNFQKKRTKTEDKADSLNHNESSVTKIEKNPIIVLPDFPFLPSSSSYLYVEKKSAAISQQRVNKYQLACNAYRKNIYRRIKNSKYSLFLPKQRHKFSPSATQCGLLTSFSPNSPSLA